MPTARNQGNLPTTSYAVLGLLTFGEMSGYDLKGLADYSIANFFWSPARSQIYSELRRLTSLGFVTETEVRQKRRPDKRIYRLTPEGKPPSPSGWSSQRSNRTYSRAPSC